MSLHNDFKSFRNSSVFILRANAMANREIVLNSSSDHTSLMFLCEIKMFIQIQTESTAEYLYSEPKVTYLLKHF